MEAIILFVCCLILLLSFISLIVLFFVANVVAKIFENSISESDRFKSLPQPLQSPQPITDDSGLTDLPTPRGTYDARYAGPDA